jgi:hypothetical protein
MENMERPREQVDPLVGGTPPIGDEAIQGGRQGQGIDPDQGQGGGTGGRPIQEDETGEDEDIGGDDSRRVPTPGEPGGPQGPDRQVDSTEDVPKTA